MKPLLLALGATAILSGCMTVTNSGAGNTSTGEPLSGTMEYNELGTAGKFQLADLKGRLCTGNVQFAGGDIDQFPITCNDGTSGNAISTINRFSSQQTVSYRLQTGETGSIALGRI